MYKTTTCEMDFGRDYILWKKGIIHHVENEGDVEEGCFAVIQVKWIGVEHLLTSLREIDGLLKL